ncbi:hypothetical protein SDC9_95767 [bioreactor metagenome]|uniref:GGDEF domain-containing protein n=1 Tax=bioreactor metagenome TaxID=1076179 RepID=A0A645A787_9ZZZZ
MRAGLLIKRICQAIQRWRYLGYDRNIIQRYRAETDRTNLLTLKRMCVLTLALFDLLVVFYGTVLRQTNRVLAVVVASAFVVILYSYTCNLLRSVSAGPIRATRSLVYLISAVMYLCGILSGTLMSGDELGVLPIWMFLLVQISFDIPPVQNALTVIPFAGLYIVVGSMVKSPQHWQLDAVYSILSITVGLYISYHQAHLALENIIAKSNLQKANFALYHTATTDELTGLMNRRMLFDRYDLVLGECVESGHSIACAVLDIDDYKLFNDTYGHPEGDELLRRIGTALRNYRAKTSIDIGRIGGEEFLAVWPEENAARCEQVAEDLRGAIESMDIPHTGAAEHGRVTMSVGLCLLPSTMAHSAYFYADKALYRAKDAGKNRCCRYDPEGGAYRFICCAGNA